MHRATIRIALTLAAILAPVAAGLAHQAGAPPPTQAGRGGRGPAVMSPEIQPDGHVVFRIAAPHAETVTLNAGDIPEPNRGGRGGPAFQKNEAGVWEAATGPLQPGAYRYVFQVDGVRVLDPVNTRLSESNTNAWSMLYVPGSDFMDTKDVPHGAVASVYYYSSVLKTTRRMHVYTPPGYETGSQKYPVFYLLHGAGDTDDAWTSVGRAGFIFDNLIATKKVKPMILVMPAGHQPGVPGFGAPPAAGPGVTNRPTAVNPFTDEFVTDIMPYAEKNYRIIPDRQHRAIAGLSMGGSQTLDIAFTHLEKFAYIGVYSSGATLGGGGRRGATPAIPAATAPPQQPRPDWEAAHKADLDNVGLKKGTRLVWLSTGVDDGLMPNTKSTVELLKKHGFQPVFKESPGAQTWINWRNYLNEFTPQLFQ